VSEKLWKKKGSNSGLSFERVDDREYGEEGLEEKEFESGSSKMNDDRGLNFLSFFKKSQRAIGPAPIARIPSTSAKLLKQFQNSFRFCHSHLE
jgi:hypothetical protein